MILHFKKYIYSKLPINWLVGINCIFRCKHKPVSYLHAGGVAGHKHPHGAGTDMIKAAVKPEDVAMMSLKEYETYEFFVSMIVFMYAF